MGSYIFFYQILENHYNLRGPVVLENWSAFKPGTQMSICLICIYLVLSCTIVYIDTTLQMSSCLVILTARQS